MGDLLVQSPTQKRRVIVKRIKRNRRELRKLCVFSSEAPGVLTLRALMDSTRALSLSASIQLDRMAVASHDLTMAMLWIKRSYPAAYKASFNGGDHYPPSEKQAITIEA